MRAGFVFSVLVLKSSVLLQKPTLKRTVPVPEEAKESSGFGVALKKVGRAAPPADDGAGFNVKLKKVIRDDTGADSDSSVASVQLKKVERKTVKKTTTTVDGDGKVSTKVEESSSTKTSTDRIGLKKRTIGEKKEEAGMEGIKLKKVNVCCCTCSFHVKEMMVG